MRANELAQKRTKDASPDKASVEKAERQDIENPHDLWEHPLAHRSLPEPGWLKNLLGGKKSKKEKKYMGEKKNKKQSSAHPHVSLRARPTGEEFHHL